MPRTPINQAELSIYSYARNGDKQPLCQYVIDVAGLRDPFSNRNFKRTQKDGRAGEVQQFVAEDPRVAAIIDGIRLIAHTQLRTQAGGGGWLSFGIRDHHGKWIAPAVTELTADALSRMGYRVYTWHYELGAGGEE